MDILLKFDVYGPLDGWLYFLSTRLAHSCIIYQKYVQSLSVVPHSCNSSTWGWGRVIDQPGLRLQCDTMFQKS